MTDVPKELFIHPDMLSKLRITFLETLVYICDKDGKFVFDHLPSSYVTQADEAILAAVHKVYPDPIVGVLPVKEIANGP